MGEDAMRQSAIQREGKGKLEDKDQGVVIKGPENQEGVGWGCQRKKWVGMR